MSKQNTNIESKKFENIPSELDLLSEYMKNIRSKNEKLSNNSSTSSDFEVELVNDVWVQKGVRWNVCSQDAFWKESMALASKASSIKDTVLFSSNKEGRYSVVIEVQSRKNVVDFIKLLSSLGYEITENNKEENKMILDKHSYSKSMESQHRGTFVIQQIVNMYKISFGFIATKAVSENNLYGTEKNPLIVRNK